MRPDPLRGCQRPGDASYTVAFVTFSSPSALRAFPIRHRPATVLVIAGFIVFAAVLASYIFYEVTHPEIVTSYPVDLHVYRIGGLIVRHIRPYYDPHVATPLYDWPGYTSFKLKFTYPPFAAVLFAVMSVIRWPVLLKLTDLANIGLPVATLWFTNGALGYRRSWQVRLGATLLTAAAVFWTEPVLRNIYVGQVNEALMALIIWDLCQPDTEASRGWKGAGVGIAAGIKLVPLIFIPYLLLARKFRQAAVAGAAFAATVLAGFVVLPRDSAKWWFSGLFVNETGRTGFAGWTGNQSLRGLITRLMGTLTALLGVVCAALLDRQGHLVAGILTCALTGLLVSPISWDHHWVWIIPGVALAGHHAAHAMAASARGAAAGQPAPQRWAARARGWASSPAGWGYWALVAGMLAIFGAWPNILWHEPKSAAVDRFGVIWAPPSTGPTTYARFGDLPSYAEYHWHGFQLIVGNAFVLTGLLLFGLLLVLAWIAPAAPPATAPVTIGSHRGAAMPAGGQGLAADPARAALPSPGPPPDDAQRDTACGEGR